MTALVVDPDDDSTLLAGTAGAGVFLSTDGGAHWKDSNQGLTDVVVQALAFDPANPDLAYAGTSGSGIFKSSDGGLKWEPINQGLTEPRVETLLIDPSDPGRLYAGTFGGGVFKTTDGGASWAAARGGLPPLSPDPLAAGGSFQSVGPVCRGRRGGRIQDRGRRRFLEVGQ